MKKRSGNVCSWLIALQAASYGSRWCLDEHYPPASLCPKKPKADWLGSDSHRDERPEALPHWHENSLRETIAWKADLLLSVAAVSWAPRREAAPWSDGSPPRG